MANATRCYLVKIINKITEGGRRCGFGLLCSTAVLGALLYILRLVVLCTSGGKNILLGEDVIRVFCQAPPRHSRWKSCHVRYRPMHTYWQYSHISNSCAATVLPSICQIPSTFHLLDPTSRCAGPLVRLDGSRKNPHQVQYFLPDGELVDSGESRAQWRERERDDFRSSGPSKPSPDPMPTRPGPTMTSVKNTSAGRWTIAPMSRMAICALAQRFLRACT